MDFIDVTLSLVEDNPKLGYSKETIIQATVLAYAPPVESLATISFTIALIFPNKVFFQTANKI